MPEEYVAEHSSHTRESTVDLPFVDIRTGMEVDMGCVFDYFGVASHPDALPGILFLDTANREPAATIDGGTGVNIT